MLRGSRALAFPLQACDLELQYAASPRKLTVHSEGVQNDVLHACLQRALERAVELLDLDRSTLDGSLVVVNRLPCGAGLGASAALCVALARWFEHLGRVPSTAVYQFARQLEDLFHGESSGLDIAVALREGPVLFRPDIGASDFDVAWTPRLFLSDSGARAATRECVDKVKALLQRSPSQGASIDTDMRDAVDACAMALREENAGAFDTLAESINLAARCFLRWGLIEQRLGDHIEDLTVAGAHAAKPTGAGIGGYVLSLWRDEPPPSMHDRLIPCFAAP